MRIFQTFILPDNLVANYKLSFAAANFSRNLQGGKGFDKCYSLIPINVTGKLHSVKETGYEVIYSNWRLKGGILSKLAIFKEQVFLFTQINRGDSLWLYNLNAINALLFVLVKFFKPSVKLNVIVLDFTPAKSWKEQNYWYLKLINKSDGTICLAHSGLFKCKNSAVLPGVVPATAGYEPLIECPNNKYLLSGVLYEQIAQISMVLNAFSEMPQCELHITGKTDNEEIIQEYASRFSNIRWHGVIPYDEYLALLHKCTFVLSTRDPECPENQCNFPSKIIEALLHNRIVISTIEYRQLNGINYLFAPSEARSFMQFVENLFPKDKDSLLKYANQGKMMSKLFSTKVWNETMGRIENQIG